MSVGIPRDPNEEGQLWDAKNINISLRNFEKMKIPTKWIFDLITEQNLHLWRQNFDQKNSIVRVIYQLLELKLQQKVRLLRLKTIFKKFLLNNS